MITTLCFDITKTGEVVAIFEITLTKRTRKSREISVRGTGAHFDIKRNGKVVTYYIPFRPKSLDKGTTYMTRDFFSNIFLQLYFPSTSFLFLPSSNSSFQFPYPSISSSHPFISLSCPFFLSIFNFFSFSFSSLFSSPSYSPFSSSCPDRHNCEFRTWKN